MIANRKVVAWMMIALLAAAGCASQPAASGPAPTVKMTQTSDVAIVQAAAGTAVPVDFRLSVTNPYQHNITLQSVELETVGQSGSYSMKRVRQAFETIIPAGATTAVDIRAWVVPLQDTAQGKIGNAVMLRGAARFDSQGAIVRSPFVARFGG